MAWDHPTVTRDDQGNATVAWAKGNTTMVGAITPWFSITTDAQLNQYSGANHPDIGATQTRIAAGHCSACEQKIYQTYTQLYDEVKLDGMTVSLSILTPVGTATLPSLSIATGWDRKCSGGEIRPLSGYWQDGLKAGSELSIKNNTLYPPPALGGDDITYPMLISRDYMASYQDLISGPNAVEATALNNSVAKIFRSCKASDLLERNTFHDGELGLWGSSTHYDKALYQGAIATDAANWATVNNSPYGFAPVFYFALKKQSPGAAVGETISVQAEVNYYFTFRNPKFGGTTFDPVSSAVAMNRAIAEGAAAQQRAAAAAAAEEPMDAQASLRSRLGDYYHIEDDDSGDLLVSPETTSAMTTSGRSTSTAGNKKKRRVAKEDDDDIVVPEETKDGFDPSATQRKGTSMDKKK